MIRRDFWQANASSFAAFTARFLLFIGFFGALLPVVGQSVHLRHEGRDYIDLATGGGRFGMDASWLSDREIFRLRSRWTAIDVGKGKKILYLNKVPIYLGFPTLYTDERLYMAEADYRHVLESILTPQVFRNPPTLQKIVIDPGHGGGDSGALNDAHGLKEKHLNLDVSKRLQRLLQSKGYEVVLTRNSDIFIPLERRTDIANYEKADLFISIHFNAAVNTQASGVETFILTPQYQGSSKFTKPASRDNVRFPGNDFDPWNTLTGFYFQRELVRGIGGVSRGLKRARFHVLKHLNCPGVLVELGFVSHRPTAQRLRSARHREQLAKSLFDAVITYHQRLQRIP